MVIQGGNSCCMRSNAHKFGSFKRKSDGQVIPRYRCKTCAKTFSPATQNPACWQKKRTINRLCLFMLTSTMSMRRIAFVLKVNRKTVARKLNYLAMISRQEMAKMQAHYQDVESIQMDELITFEHTKCKPLSVCMAVTDKGRKILGFRVSKMPASGHLAKIARKKYGHRPDHRLLGLDDLFSELKSVLKPTISIQSDECPFYKQIIKNHFPNADYKCHIGLKSAIAGQGELKKAWRDPLFAINHTFAMLRANINRLIRRTWCSTKKIPCLEDHLALYAWVHNSKLQPAK